MSLPICRNCASTSISRVREVNVTPSQIKTSLVYCHNCDFLFLADTDWIDMAYQIGFYGDTGYVQRNLQAAAIIKRLLRMFDIFYNKSHDFEGCDIGTGLGMLPRLLRDYGYNFFGQDEYARMELIAPFVSRGEHALVKTSFEVIEHIDSLPNFFTKHINPDLELFVFSTCFREKAAIPAPTWWYYAFNIGQHISFHSKASFDYALNASCSKPNAFFSLGSGIYAISFSRRWTRILALNRKLTNLRLGAMVDFFLSIFPCRTSLCEADHLKAVSML